MKTRMILLGLLVVALVACGGENRGSGSRMGVPAIPGQQGFSVPPLDPPDTFFRVDTLTNRNPTIQTPFLQTSKDSMTATTLRSGLVVIIGGTTGGTALTETEIYDQRSAEFSPTGMMGQARRHHTATLTSAGDIVIVGGIGQNTNPLVSAEIWSSASGSFKVVQQMSSPRVGHTATALPSGEILVVGGFTDSNSSNVTEKVQGLNLSTTQWREFTALQATTNQRGIPRTLHSAVTIPGQNGIAGDGDDEVVIIGGLQGDRVSKKITTITNSITIFDPNQSTTPPGKPQLPGRWQSLSVTGSNALPARMDAHAFVVATDATHPLTQEKTTQIVVFGGFAGNVGNALGPMTATQPARSVYEDSPGDNESYWWYCLDIENKSLLGSANPKGDISQDGCIGHWPYSFPACPPFVGGMGARAVYNGPANMILYCGGNSVVYQPVPARVGYNRDAWYIDLVEDPATGYITPVPYVSSGQMGDLRSWHVATLLPGPDGVMNTVDDTAFVAGGEQNPAGENQTADEYRFP